MYVYIVMALGRSITGIIADLRKDPRFAESKIICVAKEGDQLEPPEEAVLTVVAQRNGMLRQKDYDAYYAVVNPVLFEERKRIAFVLNGGTTPQAVVLFKLWQEDDASCKDAFDVQRDAIVEIEDHMS